MKHPMMLSLVFCLALELMSCRFTGNWSSSLSVMPLNSPSAKIFWRMLHTREVQAKSFGFGLLSSDSNSNLFFKVLKKKLVDLVSNAVTATMNCVQCTVVMSLHLFFDDCVYPLECCAGVAFEIRTQSN